MSYVLTDKWDLVRDENPKDELRTAILISLLTEARAPDDMVLPNQDRGGWHGDTYPDQPGFRLGSLLWTLRGRKIDAGLLTDAESFADQSLAWMVDRGYLRKVYSVPVRIDSEAIGISVWVQRPDDPAPSLFDTWEVSLR